MLMLRCSCTEIFLGIFGGRGVSCKASNYGCMMCTSMLQAILWTWYYLVYTNMDVGCCYAYSNMYIQHKNFKVGGGRGDNHEVEEDSSPPPPLWR